MTIDTPKHLLICNESSGSSITNYGSAGTAYTVNRGSSGTDYKWHNGAGSYDGYYEGVTAGGSSTPYGTTTGTQSTTPATVCFAAGFRLASPLNNSVATIFGFGATDLGNGIRVRCVDDGAGGFDLIPYLSSTTGASVSCTLAASGLTFNTDYFVSGMVDFGDITNVAMRCKLSGNAVVPGSGTGNWTGELFTVDQPTFAATYDDVANSNIRGLTGFIYYWAYWLGGNAFSDTDMANINTSPKTYIPNWPGGTTSTIAFGTSLLQRETSITLQTRGTSSTG